MVHFMDPVNSATRYSTHRSFDVLCPRLRKFTSACYIPLRCWRSSRMPRCSAQPCWTCPSSSSSPSSLFAQTVAAASAEVFQCRALTTYKMIAVTPRTPVCLEGFCLPMSFFCGGSSPFALRPLRPASPAHPCVLAIAMAARMADVRSKKSSWYFAAAAVTLVWPRKPPSHRPSPCLPRVRSPWTARAACRLL